jgi:cardiolipin synthase
VELTIKIVALGTVPNNRRPSSSIAWLLLIVVTPIIGLVIFLLIGSPFVRGRRAKVQAEANQVITERTEGVPDLPAGADIPVGVDSLFRLNRALTQLPCVTGVSHGLFGDYDASIQHNEVVERLRRRCMWSSLSPHGMTPPTFSVPR